METGCKLSKTDCTPPSIVSGIRRPGGGAWLLSCGRRPERTFAASVLPCPALPGPAWPGHALPCLSFPFLAWPCPAQSAPPIHRGIPYTHHRRRRLALLSISFRTKSSSLFTLTCTQGPFYYIIFHFIILYLIFSMDPTP